MTEGNSYIHFSRLETRLKIALAIYIFLLLSGGIVLGFGIWNIIHYTEMQQPGFFFLVNLAALGLYFVVIFSLDKIHWISKIHMWLDRQLFGFLKRSNDAILLSLLTALNSEEQKLVNVLETTKRRSIGESIFAALSKDYQLSQKLLHSGIFSAWTWYWISIYGTLTFIVLTITAFIFVVSDSDTYTNLLFTIYWIFAVIHVMLVVIIGYRLIRMSKATMSEIIESHKEQITMLLRKNIR